MKWKDSTIDGRAYFIFLFYPVIIQLQTGNKQVSDF